MPLFKLFSVHLRLILFLVLISAFVFGQDNMSQPSSVQTGSIRIEWEGRAKIARYRLQLSRNAQFSDIVFDKVVEGREYTVTELHPGVYFWRVAPAASETGAYSKPIAITISPQGVAEPIGPPKPKVLSPPSDIGWRTATGYIEQPQVAKLRAGSNFDVIGVNAYGMVYAINGETGLPNWSARYHPDAKKGEPTNSDGSRPFTPLLFEGKNRAVNVLVAFDGGVRALDGATGREMWRVALPGEASVGISLNHQSDGSAAMGISDSSRALTFVKGETGQVISQTKIDGALLGAPTALTVKGERGVLMALNNGTLEMRNMAGVSILAIRLDSTITAGPLMVQAPRGQLIMLGTEAGLVALDATDLTPLWRIATESDAPQGIISAADLDSDGIEEVVMITRRGRLVAVNISSGKIKWFTDGFKDASKAAFADVNGDGTTDVLIAGGAAFAVGFSGKDGAMIWRADEISSSRPVEGELSPRVLAVASVGGGGLAYLVGADPGRTGLRAVGLPSGAVK